MAALHWKNQPLILTKTVQALPTGRKRQKGILEGSQVRMQSAKTSTFPEHVALSYPSNMNNAKRYIPNLT
jgi:hypothetical protein